MNKQYSIFHLYLPSPSPFWDDLREKYKGRLSGVIRSVIEEAFDNKENVKTAKYVEISIDGIMYCGLMRKL